LSPFWAKLCSSPASIILSVFAQLRGGVAAPFSTTHNAARPHFCMCSHLCPPSSMFIPVIEILCKVVGIHIPPSDEIVDEVFSFLLALALCPVAAYQR
jgi:hypothetical protein